MPKRVDAFRGRESFPKLRMFEARVAFRDARLTSRTRQIMHIPSEYGWTLIAIGGACAATIFGSIKVSLARRKFGVEYPTLYAESSHKNAKAFNCVQRAHQQTLEWMAPVMCLTASTGLVFPLAAAVSCGVWTVGKLLYIQGYSSGDPNGRHLGGAIAHLGDLPLIVMAFVAGNKVLNA